MNKKTYNLEMRKAIFDIQSAKSIKACVNLIKHQTLIYSSDDSRYL